MFYNDLIPDGEQQRGGGRESGLQGDQRLHDAPRGGQTSG